MPAPRRPADAPNAGSSSSCWGTYAYFWQARDWNCASRLMLTYAPVDRGTIAIIGLEDQTGDKAVDRGGYYTDRLLDFSLRAAGPCALAKAALRLPDHGEDPIRRVHETRPTRGDLRLRPGY